MSSIILSVFIHLGVFVAGNALIVRPAQYAVETGLALVEVQLMAAPLVINAPLATLSSVEESVVPLKEQPALMEKPQEQQVVNTPQLSGARTNAKPDFLKNPAPMYPIGARRLGQEGVVVLSLRVDRLGKAFNVLIKRSSGYPLLDRSAFETVKRWQFLPAAIGGIAVESGIEVPVRFMLKRSFSSKD